MFTYHSKEPTWQLAPLGEDLWVNILDITAIFKAGNGDTIIRLKNGSCCNSDVTVQEVISRINEVLNKDEDEKEGE